MSAGPCFLHYARWWSSILPVEKSKNASESNKEDDICKVFGVHVVKSVKVDAIDGFGKMSPDQGIN